MHFPFPFLPKLEGTWLRNTPIAQTEGNVPVQPLTACACPYSGIGRRQESLNNTLPAMVSYSTMVLRRECRLSVRVHLGSRELCGFCLMLKLGLCSEISEKQSSDSPGRCAQLDWIGEIRRPLISTNSGSKPRLSLMNEKCIHAFISTQFVLSDGNWHFSHSPLLFYWLRWLTSLLTYVNFSLVRSTGLSHSWAGWQLLPLLCSPLSCISFHWDILSLSGVSKALLNCLYHFENLFFNGWLTLTVLFGIYGHEAVLW